MDVFFIWSLRNDYNVSKIKHAWWAQKLETHDKWGKIIIRNSCFWERAFLPRTISGSLTRRVTYLSLIITFHIGMMTKHHPHLEPYALMAFFLLSPKYEFELNNQIHSNWNKWNISYQLWNRYIKPHCSRKYILHWIYISETNQWWEKENILPYGTWYNFSIAKL